MSTVGTPEEIANLALKKIGYPVEIGSIYDGTKPARAALQFYAQTRDDLLRAKLWSFARRSAVLSLLKTAPPGGYGYRVVWSTSYPPPPWIYEYAYPDDCLRVRTIRGTPIVLPAFEPVAVPWVDTNDQSLTPPARVILTNQPAAIAVYTGQVVDITTWPADFTETMVEALGVRLAQALTAEAMPLAARQAREAVGLEQAATRRG